MNTHARRITLAIGLSLLIHAAILYLPLFKVPYSKITLPPLTVRLETLADPLKPSSVKPQSAHQEQAKQIAKLNDGTANPKRTPAMVEMKKTDTPVNQQPFPKVLQLTFIEYQDNWRSRIGEIHHQLNIHDNRYVLKSQHSFSGSKYPQIIQTSNGKIGGNGLQPDNYEQQSYISGIQDVKQVIFDWANQKVHFPDGAESALPSDCQDNLSYMYQLSQLPLNAELINLSICDVTQVKQEQIEIGVKEDIDTPIGKLHTRHLQKTHAGNEAYFELWLGLEYRMLPVKYVQFDDSGHATEEFVISNIRATNE